MCVVIVVVLVCSPLRVFASNMLEPIMHLKYKNYLFLLFTIQRWLDRVQSMVNDDKDDSIIVITPRSNTQNNYK